MSKCIDPSIGQMIGRYEFDLLTPEEKEIFEAHFIECDACFQDLHSFLPVVNTIKKHRKEFQKSVKDKKEGFQLYKVMTSIKPVRLAIIVAALILITIISYQINYLLINPRSPGKIAHLQGEPQILTPHGPDIQPLRGDSLTVQSSIEQSLIQSMQVKLDVKKQEISLFWKEVSGVQSYSIILIDQTSQDTIFSMTRVKKSPLIFSFSEIPPDHQIEWQLSGFSDNKRILRVKKIFN